MKWKKELKDEWQTEVNKEIVLSTEQRATQTSLQIIHTWINQCGSQSSVIEVCELCPSLPWSMNNCWAERKWK